MPKDSMTKEEMQGAYKALCNWFDSQNIDMANGGYLCAQMAGFAVGLLANDQKHYEKGLKLMTGYVRTAAKDAYDNRDLIKCRSKP